MEKYKYKVLLSVLAGALQNREDHITDLEARVLHWETQFSKEVERRKVAHLEWEAARELANRLEGS